MKGLSLRNLLVLRGERSFGGSAYFKHVAACSSGQTCPMRAAEFVAIQAGLMFVLGSWASSSGSAHLPARVRDRRRVMPEFIVRRKANARRKRSRISSATR